MKVALVSYEFGEYCVRLASALSRIADVLLLLPQQIAAPHLSSLDARVDLQPFDKPRLRHPRRQVVLGLEMVRRIKAFNPDVVHLQQGHLWFNGFLPLLRRYPLVLTAHDVRHHPGDNASRKTPQAVMDFGFRCASRLIVHATALKDIIVRQCRVPPQIVDVVPHISVGSTPDLTPSHAHGPTVLFFGRIWPYKGLQFLIRAEPLITQEIPDVKFVIAGEGEDFARYRRMMIHPDRFVVYNEYVPDDRGAELFRQASVVVLPYVEASQSGVIPLAYTWMKPIVATSVGGLPEMVENGRTGYLVAPRDEEALASAIVRLLRDPPLCRQMGLNGKRKLDAEFAPDLVARQTLDVYQRTVAEWRVRHSRWLARPHGPRQSTYAEQDRHD
jgi:glycosyltransferase involved in cell wall biosynthesis